MLGPMSFRFLNETRQVGDGRWGNDAPSQLWRYNLHYFDDLNSFDSASRDGWHVEAIAGWIRDNPPAGGDAWAPYPTSLRVVNWIKRALNGAVLDDPVIHSLAMQVRVLSQRLEYHLLGNHLFANAKALVFAGLFFDGSEAERWLAKGMNILVGEFPEQILADGGQFERSPMYHALALEDVLDLINVGHAMSRAFPDYWMGFADTWPGVAQRMRTWLRVMCHPDGEISLFNDAAIGIAPSPAELERYANELLDASEVSGSGLDASDAVRVVQLSDSGYIRADTSDAALFLDVAPVGPDYLPGHAHADTLSFELSLFGQRVIVNGGTSQYGLGPERDAERGTPAHSTVTVDEQDSSEVWAGFRVARRARPFDLALEHQAEHLLVACSHDGYRRLPGRPVHRRTWILEPRTLHVEDRIDGRFQTAIARFHLHPGVECTIDTATSSGSFRLPNGHTAAWRATGGRVHAERSLYRPEFGRRIPTQCLVLKFDGVAAASMEINW